MILYVHALHHICIFNNDSCIFNNDSCIFRCVLVGLNWAKPMMFLMLHVTCSCICTFIYLYSDIDLRWCFFACFSFSLSLFLLLVALWHLNRNLLRPRTLFIPEHLLLLPLLILHHFPSGSAMIKPIRTFWRTFPNATFIQNAKSFYRIFLILTFPLLSIVGVGSYCVASWSLVLP